MYSRDLAAVVNALGDATFVHPNRLNQEVCGAAEEFNDALGRVRRSGDLSVGSGVDSGDFFRDGGGCREPSHDAAVVENRALRVRGRFLKPAPFNSCQGGEVFLVQNDPNSCGSGGGTTGERPLPRAYSPPTPPDANNPVSESAAAALRTRASGLAAAAAGLSAAWRQHQLASQWRPEAILAAAAAFPSGRSSHRGGVSVFVRCQTFSGARSGSWLAHRAAVLKASWADVRALRAKNNFDAAAWFGAMVCAQRRSTTMKLVLLACVLCWDTALLSPSLLRYFLVRS